MIHLTVTSGSPVQRSHEGQEEMVCIYHPEGKIYVFLQSRQRGTTAWLGPLSKTLDLASGHDLRVLD